MSFPKAAPLPPAVPVAVFPETFRDGAQRLWTSEVPTTAPDPAKARFHWLRDEMLHRD